MAKEEFKSGFAVLVGRPNVGKSTLLNSLVGQKVAIVSDKPQTTRHKIQAVLTQENAQIVFLDTPGIHKPKHKLGEYLVQVALRTMREVDIVLFLVEAGSPPGVGDKYIIRLLAGLSIPVILIINKIDLASRAELLHLIDSYRVQFGFAEIVPVSALTGENLNRLLTVLVSYLPTGPKYYPDDITVDKPERFVMAELIREKIICLTNQEVPHSVAVVVEEVEKQSNDVVTVRAIIYTEKESQKGILIGKGGQMLKKAGQLAREEMESLFGSRIFLDLWVKVKPDWRNREAYLRSFGYTGRE